MNENGKLLRGFSERDTRLDDKRRTPHKARFAKDFCASKINRSRNSEAARPGIP